MGTHNTGVVSSIPPCAAIKTPLVRKATGNHLIESTALEKAQSPVSGFCNARNRVRNRVEDLIRGHIIKNEYVTGRSGQHSFSVSLNLLSIAI